MDAAALSAPGPDDGWAVKDHLVHVAAWEHSLLALFEGRDRAGGDGRGRRMTKRSTTINAVVFEQHRHDTLDRGAARTSATRTQQLMAVLDTQSTEDFQRPYRPSSSRRSASRRTQPVLDGGGRQHLRALRRAHRLDQGADERSQRSSLSARRSRPRLRLGHLSRIAPRRPAPAARRRASTARDHGGHHRVAAGGLVVGHQQDRLPARRHLDAPRRPAPNESSSSPGASRAAARRAGSPSGRVVALTVNAAPKQRRA